MKLQEYKYKHVKVNEYQQKTTSIYNAEDHFHKQLLAPDATINMLRSEPGKPSPKKGIYVEYTKVISENEKKTINKINNKLD